MLIFPRGIYAPKRPLPTGGESLFICSSMEDIAEKNVHYGPLSSDKKDIVRAVPLELNTEYTIGEKAYVIVAKLRVIDFCGHTNGLILFGTRDLEEAEHVYGILERDNNNGTLTFFETDQGKKVRSTQFSHWKEDEPATFLGLSPILEWLPDGMWVD